jgi:4-amino-4-deoxy-L-arabinose transferase-like glycosyltransferase
MKFLNPPPLKKPLVKTGKFGNINLIIALLIVVGLLRIASTYGVFWQTADEPAHVATGMEWLSQGKYTYEHLHPPLARVMVALGPFLDGVKSIGLEKWWDEGNALLHANGLYERHLTLARLGVLPFFVLATLVVWKWTKLYFGTLAALLSVILLTTLPPVLAHSGVATTDMAFTAMFVTVLFAFSLWLEKPTLLRSHLLGISLGLACLAKFSALAFLPLSLTAIAVLDYFRKINSNEQQVFRLKRWIAAAGIAILICLLTIWAGYRFSYGRVSSVDPEVHERLESIFVTQGLLYNAADFMVEKVPLPAPEFFSGIIQVAQKNQEGHLNYLFGELRKHGWWYFFPTLLFVKTPLPFLLLTAIGLFALLMRVVKQRKELHLLGAAVAAIVILAISMRSNINIGLRHLLPIYPLLAIVAGYGGFRLWSFRQSRGIGRILLTLLLTWQISSSFMAHPDYLPYFNLFAGNHPEKNFSDSDLDWGQDLKRGGNK